MPSMADMPGCFSAGSSGLPACSAARASSSAQPLRSVGVRGTRLLSQSAHSSTVAPASQCQSAFFQALQPPAQLATQYTPGDPASSSACSATPFFSPSTSTTVRPAGEAPPGKYSGRGSSHCFHVQRAAPSRADWHQV
jgi:hypothetical protein